MVFLGEAISYRRWIGVFLVALGVFFTARPAARAEDAARAEEKL
jgi:drug/metabolite transporter (DMT)-like permease